MAELESLFLLELLVDCVTFTTQEVSNLKETCVKFEFLQFPPFYVCEEDFAPNADGYESSDIPFNGGKSILFSMSEYKAGNSINLNVTVLRSDETGKKIEIGKTVVPLGSSFTNLFNSTNKEPLSEPVAKTIRDTYNFSNNKNAVTGRFSLLVRLSCFGCAIVTQFEVTDPEEPCFKFKNEQYKATSGTYIKVSTGKSQVDGQELDNSQKPESTLCPCPQNSTPQSGLSPYQNAPPNPYFRPPIYAPPPPNIYPYPNQFYGGQYSQNMGYPQYPSPMFNPQFGQCQIELRRPQQYQEIPQMPKTGVICTCDNTKSRPQTPPKKAFRRCYVLGEGIGPLPRSGDIFSWTMPSITEKDKKRDELLGGPIINWEITPTQMLKQGDLIQVDAASAGPKKSKSDHKMKLGKRGRGKGKKPKGTAVVPLDRDKNASKHDNQSARKKKKNGKAKVTKKVGVSVKGTSKTEVKKSQVNTFNKDELKVARELSEEKLKEMKALNN